MSYRFQPSLINVLQYWLISVTMFFAEVCALLACMQICTSETLLKGYCVFAADMHQQVFVRGLDGRTLVVDLAPGARVSELKEDLRSRLGLPCDQQRLLASGRPLDDADTLEAGCSLDLSLRLVGGVIEPSLRILAQKYNCDKMICRK